ncbi:CTP synthase [Brumimicrobium aurantiacum]|uniref:CTP synthase (glutamine hydrolyzing) n=1 Tax=Brumimicrobium aurantiacum TaxID=1737063 RepID=A0A3E1F1C0_9FLAO|nr:hypothetical protein [Brumimicrobium aurantiacum]RFC55614.1 hypothetical protein DXU93_01395 [Brumimicrobium aurantiacum]
MTESIKIVIIGDFNFTFNAHHATNLAVEHSAELLGLSVNYYWMRTHEASKLKPNKFTQFDGVIVAPGPYDNAFFIEEILKSVLASQIALLVTGESFRSFLNLIIKMYHLNPDQEKVLSENLVVQNSFEKVEVTPISEALKGLYQNQSRAELTNARFSIYPHIYEVLKAEVLDIEAVNQFNEPEIISLKTRPFCVASMSLPQVCSTSEIPHPLISGFLSFSSNWEAGKEVKKQG